MSRIEKSLEKALELREFQKPEASEKTAAAFDTGAAPRSGSSTAVIERDNVDEHVVCLTDPKSPVAEQYKQLRSRLLMATKKDFHNTILVTSSGANEGKSITAVNLAVALANAYDHTVLLVDADLRNPSISRYLGITPERGLGDYLSGKAELHEVIINTNIGRLSILPAGNQPENPAEVLASEKMKTLVQEMKNRYKDRYIIFDSSPILATADALSLSNYVDGILLVVQADRTSEKTVSQALSHMRGFNILGVVLNNMPQRLATAIYPYYGDYYKKPQIGKNP